MNVFRYSLVSIYTLLLLLASGAIANEADGQPKMTLDQVVEEMKKTEGRVNSLYVTMTTTGTTRLKEDGGVADANFIETCHVDIKGMGWAKGQGEGSQDKPDGTKIRSKESYAATFDGKAGKSLRRTTIAGQKEFVLASMEKKLRGRLGSPFQFVERLSSAIEKGGYEFAPPQDWDGRKVIVLVKIFEHDAPGVPDRKTEIWIDPKLDYSVVRRRQFMLDEVDADWDIESTRDSHDHEEIAKGIWLPKRAKIALYFPSGLEKTESEYTFRNWAVNKEMEPEKLKLEFPEGVRIRNAR